MKKVIVTIMLLACCATLVPAQSDRDQKAFSKSYTLEGTGDFSKAIVELKNIYDERSYEINLRLGWLHYENKLYTESVSYYQRAIALMPYSIEAKLGIVYPLSTLGNWEQVVSHYKKILEIDPQNTTVNYRMGVIEYNRKNYAAAYRFFEKVVNLYPFSYDALIMFAWSNYQLGKTREANVLFNKVLILSPNDASAIEGLRLLK